MNCEKCGQLLQIDQMQNSTGTGGVHQTCPAGPPARIVMDRPKGTCPGCGFYCRLSIVYQAEPHRFFVCNTDCWNQNFKPFLGSLDYVQENPELFPPETPDLVDASRSAAETENAASNHLKLKPIFALIRTRGANCSNRKLL